MSKRYQREVVVFVIGLIVGLSIFGVMSSTNRAMVGMGEQIQKTAASAGVYDLLPNSEKLAFWLRNAVKKGGDKIENSEASLVVYDVDCKELRNCSFTFEIKDKKEGSIIRAEVYNLDYR